MFLVVPAEVCQSKLIFGEKFYSFWKKFLNIWKKVVIIERKEEKEYY